MTSTPNSSPTPTSPPSPAPAPVIDDALALIQDDVARCEASPSSLPLGEMMVAVGYSELKAVVERLEAAEDVIMDAEAECGIVNPLLIDVWRQRAGKAEGPL